MEQYELIDERFVLPTPAGVYYATASNKAESSRRLLLALMTQTESQLLTVDKLCSLSGINHRDTALELLHKMQNLEWLESYEKTRDAPTGPLEHLLPSLLAELCSTQKALLADHQGFHLATHGFTHEAAEELSALSADLASLRLRHRNLLFNNLNIKTHALGLIDAAGDCQLGFWPLYIGKNCFTLVMSGIPQFNQPNFTKLVWTLTNRYAANDFETTSSSNDIFDDKTGQNITTENV